MTYPILLFNSLHPVLCAAVLLLATLTTVPLHAAQVQARPAAAKPATVFKTESQYANRADIGRFITDMVDRHGFVDEELRALFRQAVYKPAIIKAITPLPKEGARARSWQAYRAIFVNPQRIEAGQRFRAQHVAALARASAQYGVPEEIILAIIGVETVYGRNMGSYRVVDALVTLGFDYPPRAAYFRGELENFLLYARDAGIDVFSVKGSYAGAIGIPQFMPGSYRRYAVDFDSDGRIDLAGNPVDAIGSVANFLKEHGWERGGTVAVGARVEGEAFRKLADGGVKPVHRIADLAGAGISLSGEAAGLPPDSLCALIELETPGQPSEFRAGMTNFYVITRYNRSSFYAASVMDLAQALRINSSTTPATTTSAPPLIIP